MKVDQASRGFVIDAPWRVTPELARWFNAQLFDDLQGFIRCAPHAGGWSPGWLGLLSADELGELTDDGFGVGMYQIFRASRQLTLEHGQACGEAMVEHAKAIGLPEGVTLWCDAEQFRDSAQTEDFISGWRGRASYFTDTRGLYEGAGCLLPSMQIPASERTARIQGDRLYGLKGINRYWLAMSQVYTPSARGPCLAQIWEYVLFGDGPKTWRVEPYNRNNPDHQDRPRFDVNASRIDSHGGRVMWAVK